MQANRIVLGAAVVGVLALCLAGCAASPSIAERLTQTWNAAVQDGVISPEEASAIKALLEEQGEEIKWPETIGAAVGSVVASFLGVNFYRSKREKDRWGTPENPKPLPSPAPLSPVPGQINTGATS
jgi:beta-glucosidase/6-phospho-beta-glucosidase/beta-galactosidase